MSKKPVIALITTGGTIAITALDRDVAVPNLTSEALLQAVPQIAQLCTIESVDLFSKPSCSITLADLKLLLSTIEQLSSKVDGVVITHGTDLMEMTSFALSLLLDVDIPVVLTGAMRRPDLPGADGPANLLSAFQVAVSEEAKGAGVLVVMNGEIIPGFFAKKQHSFLPQAFSNNTIGWVAEDRVRLFYKEQVRKPRLSLGDKCSSILVLEGGFDITRSDISAIAFDKLDAFVFSITGAGHVSGAITGDLEDIAKRLPIVFASRTEAGETYKSYYGYEGSERDLISKGLIPGGYLNARQVRMLLLLAYSHGNLSIGDTAELLSMFN